MASIDQALRAALELHQSGQLAKARRIYHQVLAAEPRHANALYLLGLVESQEGRHEAAIDLFARAIRISPRQASFHHYLGQACQSLSRNAEARAAFAKALKLDPKSAATHYQWALLEHADGDLDAAEHHYEKAVRLRHDFVEARVNLGDLLRKRGKLEQAAASYQAAVRFRGDCIEARQNLGAGAVDLGRWSEAVDCLTAALAMNSDSPEAHYNLGRAYKGLGARDEAQACFNRALAVRPDFAIAHFALANLFLEHDALDAAEESYRKAVQLSPQDADFASNFGKVLSKQGRLPEALDQYARAIELDPDLAIAHFSRAMILLRDANFAEGWKEYEWRLKLPKFPVEPRDEPLWQGQNLPSETLLVHAEQGLGDTLQFIRFVPQVKRRAAKVIVRVQTALAPLLRQSGLEVVGREDPLRRCDFHVPLMSLPGILGTDLSNIPAPIPYLHANRELVESWRRRLETIEGMKIGISWQGSPAHASDRERSVPLESFLPVAQIAGVTLVSLQKDAGTDQIAASASRFRVVELDGLDAHGGAFLDTAAVMRNLDLVITSDTAVAHLAGALGVNVWIALAKASDWRWLAHREDSPWYPTARLFRQSTRGDWSSVFRAIATEIGRMTSSLPSNA